MVSVVLLLLWESGRSTREEGEKTAEWGLSISVVEYSRRYRSLGYVSVWPGPFAASTQHATAHVLAHYLIIL